MSHPVFREDGWSEGELPVRDVGRGEVVSALWKPKGRVLVLFSQIFYLDFLGIKH
jgi:hypothetical protein